MPTIRHLQVKGGELITQVDDPYAIGYGTDYLIELEASKNPSTLENLPAMDDDPAVPLPYVVMPTKPKPQESDAWKLGCVLFVIAVGVVLMLAGKYAGLWL